MKPLLVELSGMLATLTAIAFSRKEISVPPLLAAEGTKCELCA